MSFFQGQERLVTMKNLLVAQSGGPSAAINATLAGVVEKAMTNQNVGKIYGAKNGIMGILTDKLIDLTETLADPETLQLLCQTPSSALGSCRMKLSDWEESTFEYDKILGIFRKYDIGYFVYIGGNDSMDTVHKLAGFCERMRVDDVKIIGAPKTIDNDLMETDHCPGFGSAAKYVAATMSEIACDCNVYAALHHDCGNHGQGCRLADGFLCAWQIERRFCARFDLSLRETLPCRPFSGGCA